LTDYGGALEAVERIVNRGGDADDALRSVLAALHERGVVSVAIRFVDAGELVDGPSVGDGSAGVRVPVVFDGDPIGELEAAVDDGAFAERVATLISPYVLVGRGSHREASTR
jgi:hypothetical protein